MSRDWRRLAALAAAAILALAAAWWVRVQEQTAPLRPSGSRARPADAATYARLAAALDRAVPAGDLKTSRGLVGLSPEITQAWNAAVEFEMDNEIAVYVIDVVGERTSGDFEARFPRVLGELERNCVVPALGPSGKKPPILCDAALLRELEAEVERFTTDSFLASFEWSLLELPLFMLLLEEPGDSKKGLDVRAFLDAARKKNEVPSFREIAINFLRQSLPNQRVPLRDADVDEGLAKMCDGGMLCSENVHHQVLAWGGWVSGGATPAERMLRRHDLQATARDVVRQWIGAQLAELSTPDRKVVLATLAFRFMLSHESEHVRYPRRDAAGDYCAEFDPQRAKAFVEQRNREALADIRATLSAFGNISLWDEPDSLIGVVLAVRVTNRLGLRRDADLGEPAPPDLERAMRLAPLLDDALQRSGGRLSTNLFSDTHPAPLTRLLSISASGIDLMPCFPPSRAFIAAHAHWLAGAHSCHARLAAKPEATAAFARDFLGDLSRLRADLDRPDAVDAVDRLAHVRLARDRSAVPASPEDEELHFPAWAFATAEAIERTALWLHFLLREMPDNSEARKELNHFANIVQTAGCAALDNIVKAGIDEPDLKRLWPYPCDRLGLLKMLHRAPGQ
ncbi:hypothetical protein WME90_12155 [Sorangium sp. So ce375]|uniref:hypothetical protein n=1 Tax=Sorangium sp. So ce375 TaxID=3133306 RepID=UPI003F5B6B28